MLLRRAFIPLFKRFNPGDITIHHHYTKQPFTLHSFKHKGYWFYGKRRERETMSLFQRMIQPGNALVEVGGHIGYVAMLFSQLVAKDGSVYVFEPGINNLPYLTQNLHDTANVTIVPLAASDTNGAATFFLEDLTGQNNTLIDNYAVFENNKRAINSKVKYRTVSITTVRLDDYLKEHVIRPDFIKVDVEGAELKVLTGLKATLVAVAPIVMVEVTHQAAAVYEILKSAGYVLFDPQRKIIDGAANLQSNTFCLHRERHASLISELSLS